MHTVYLQMVDDDFFDIDLEDYTVDIRDIIATLPNKTDIDQCCDYEFQILDKFCASQSSV